MIKVKITACNRKLKKHKLYQFGMRKGDVTLIRKFANCSVLAMAPMIIVPSKFYEATP